MNLTVKLTKINFEDCLYYEKKKKKKITFFKKFDVNDKMLFIVSGHLAKISFYYHLANIIISNLHQSDHVKLFLFICN